jgi:hypothetical protein
LYYIRLLQNMYYCKCTFNTFNRHLGIQEIFLELPSTIQSWHLTPYGGPKLQNLTQTLNKRQYILCSVSPWSPEHKIFLLFIELNNEETNIFWDGELTKRLVNRYIIWICQRFVKQNKVLRFHVHMKTSHKSKYTIYVHCR